MSENLTPYTTLDGRRLTYGITWEGKLYMHEDEAKAEVPAGMVLGSVGGGLRQAVSYKEDISNQITQTEKRLSDLRRMLELLDRNPDMQELLTLMQQSNLKRLY